MGSCFEKPKDQKGFTNITSHHRANNDESLTTTISDLNPLNMPMHQNISQHPNFHSNHHSHQHHSNLANLNNNNSTTTSNPSNNNNNNNNQNSSNRKDLYAALYDYDARGHQDLSFKTGDNLIIKKPEYVLELFKCLKIKPLLLF